MKYIFKEEDVNGKKIKIVDVYVLDKEYDILNSLGRLSGAYVKEIVQKMEEVRDGKQDYYCFGPEDSVIVEVAGPTYRKVEFRGKAVITKHFSDYYKVTEFEEIYTLMKDYRDEIIKWEAKTGREKPGW